MLCRFLSIAVAALAGIGLAACSTNDHEGVHPLFIDSGDVTHSGELDHRRKLPLGADLKKEAEASASSSKHAGQNAAKAAHPAAKGACPPCPKKSFTKTS